VTRREPHRSRIDAHDGLAGRSPRLGSIETELLFNIRRFERFSLFAAGIEKLHQSFVVPREFDFAIEVIDLG
jgi:hypothetical protein